MTGDADPVGGGVWVTYYGRGTLLPGSIEGMDTVQRVRVGDGGDTFDRAQDNTAWSSSRRDMKLDNLGHGGRASDVLHGIPVQGSPAELPVGGMHRTSNDEDGDAGTFSVPACPGHHGHFGGGKPPPVTVTPMRNARPLVYTEWKAPCQHTVRHGSGAKEAAGSGGGVEGEHREVI